MDVPSIISALDDHGFADTSTPRKLEAINSAYHDLCARMPWPFLEATAAVTTDAQGKVTSPTDIRAVREFSAGDYTGDIQWLRRDEFLGQYMDRRTETGNPYYYFFQAGSLYVWPIKNASSWGVLDYYRAEPDLGSTDAEALILLPPRHHRRLIDGALVYLYNMEDDPELAAIYDERFERGIMNMMFDLQTRQTDRPDTIKVLAEDW